MGDCLGFKKELKLAESAYKRAIALSPNDWKAWDNLGQLFDKQDRYVEARAAFVRALKVPTQRIARQ